MWEKNEYMKKISAIFISIFLLSCNNENTDIAETRSDDLRVNGVSTTAFTATISGVFDNISKIDIALGKNGVLYCPKTDKAESIFKSWLEGNDSPECSIYINKDGLNGESFNATIESLYPGTDYCCCLFSQGQSSDKRKISSVITFTTSIFNPEFKELIIENIHYIDASVRGSIMMNEADFSNCTIGILMNESAEEEINGMSVITEIDNKYGNNFSIVVRGIKPDKTYYCRSFVKYIEADGIETYLYGPEKYFSTLLSENLYVDLGLPSGIKWAKCDLGEWEYNNDYQSDDLFFRWGSVVPSKRYDANKNNYEYWNKTSNNYVEIGQEISNTKYDVVKVMMGGKWRMPKKEDVEELAEICNVKSFAEVEYNLYDHTKDQLIKDWCYEGIIIGPNNNRIKMSSNYMYWTGTADEEQPPFDYCFYPIRDENSHSEVGNITLGTIFRKREEPHRIRPVWDPNL